jgi:hypothetical protein
MSGSLKVQIYCSTVSRNSEHADADTGSRARGKSRAVNAPFDARRGIVPSMINDNPTQRPSSLKAQIYYSAIPRNSSVDSSTSLGIAGSEREHLCRVIADHIQSRRILVAGASDALEDKERENARRPVTRRAFRRQHRLKSVRRRRLTAHCLERGSILGDF